MTFAEHELLTMYIEISVDLKKLNKLTDILRGSQNLSKLSSRTQPAGQPKIYYFYIPQWAQIRQENILGLHKKNIASVNSKLDGS